MTTTRPLRTAQRLDQVQPFYVMEVAKASDALARTPACDPAQGGEPMINLYIGEPDFTAAPAVLAAAQACLQRGQTQYTHAPGLWALRQRIAAWYGTRFDIQVEPERILVTAGASAALQLVALALFEPGDEVLMPDPSYPCNRQFVAAAGGTARLVTTGPDTRWQLSAATVADHWTPATRGVLLASPSNPTGTSIAQAEMATIADVVRARGGVTIVDEIYLGLSYEEQFGHSALQLGDDIVSVNSFSKYFGMTGWRLGWLVLPRQLVAPMERLAQNLYICASAVAQHAALACFEPASLAEYELRRAEFKRRRDYVVGALEDMGLPVPVRPDGAFYVWFDCTRYNDDSWEFCFDMLRRAHVALTPGRDFGPAHARRYVRLSFASSMEHLRAAVGRLQRELGR